MKNYKSGMAMVLSVAALGGHGLALAQQYPAKAVRVIVPFAPGGGSDITARQVSQKLSEHLGQQFVVDNRGGAGGVIGMEMVAKAVPDGYTIMVMSGSFSATAATHRPAFDPINSIIPVAEVGIAPFVLSVHPSLPSKTTKEFIALAVTTAKPWFALPGVPTMGETLPGYEVELWFGVMAPRGTPPAVIERLNATVNKFLQDADMKKNLDVQGMIPTGGSAQKYGERIRADYARWVKVVDAAGIKAE